MYWQITYVNTFDFCYSISGWLSTYVLVIGISYVVWNGIDTWHNETGVDAFVDMLYDVCSNMCQNKSSLIQQELYHEVWRYGGGSQRVRWNFGAQVQEKGSTGSIQVKAFNAALSEVVFKKFFWITRVWIFDIYSFIYTHILFALIYNLFVGLPTSVLTDNSYN